MEKYTITEYADKIGKTREAVFYQIKTKKIKAKKNKNKQWEIFINDTPKEEKQNKSNDDLLDLKIKVALFDEQKRAYEENFKKENAVLEERIKGLQTELANKNEIIKAKNEIIEAEKRTNIALLTTIEHQKTLIQKPKKSFFSKLLFWKENK